MQKNCAKVKELLSPYIDGVLSAEEKVLVCEHLKLCDDCRQGYEFLNGITEAAQAMPALTVSSDLHTRIMQSVNQAARAKAVPKAPGRSLWQMASGFAVAAAVIAISVVSFGSLPGHPDLTAEPTPRVETNMIAETPPEVVEPKVEQNDVPAVKRQTLPETYDAIQTSPAEAAESAVPTAEVPSEPAEAVAPSEPDIQVEEPSSGDGSGAVYEVTQIPSLQEKTVDAMTCYYITDASYEEAVLILDAYEFDGLAYLIPQAEKETVYHKLQSLPGYVRYTEEGEQTDFVRIALANE